MKPAVHIACQQYIFKIVFIAALQSDDGFDAILTAFSYKVPGIGSDIDIR
jgi:hypothetical protein